MFVKSTDNHLILSNYLFDIISIGDILNILYYKDKLYSIIIDTKDGSKCSLSKDIDKPDMIICGYLPSLVYKNKKVVILSEKLEYVTEKELINCNPICSTNGIVVYNDGTIQLRSDYLFNGEFINYENMSINKLDKFIILNYKENDIVKYSSVFIHKDNSIYEIGSLILNSMSLENILLNDKYVISMTNKECKDYKSINYKEHDDVYIVSKKDIIRKHDKIFFKTFKIKDTFFEINRFQFMLECLSKSKIIFKPSKLIKCDEGTIILNELQNNIPYAILINKEGVNLGLFAEKVDKEECLKNCKN